MKNALFIILLLSLHHLLPAQVRELEGESFDSRVLNKRISYSIVLPADYHTSQRSYPVVYMLHGMGDNASSWIEYGQVAQIVDRMVAEQQIEPFIAVMPQGDRDYYTNYYDGSYPYEDMFVGELVPLIDRMYRTKASAGQRAVMGYSMGGFGALTLPMKYPNTFNTILSLSASIRTDSQYMNAPQQEWDEQWGRIFGGRGEIGESRITQYYKENSPHHLVAKMNNTNLHIFIDNGDKEGTLCRSNEELHILLVEQGVEHTYRVRSGGHDFGFWRSAMPDAFRFADCAFRGRKYEPIVPKTPRAHQYKLIEQQVGGCTLYLPQDTSHHKRLYPVVYVTGRGDRNELMQQYRTALDRGEYAPLIFCFVPESMVGNLVSQVIPEIEKSASVSSGRRFRAIWITNGTANEALETALTPDVFAGCMVTNADISLSEQQIETLVRKSRNAPVMWIDIPSQSKFYSGSSFLHVALREADIRHEFRARDYTLPSLWTTSSEALAYIDNKFHH